MKCHMSQDCLRSTSMPDLIDVPEEVEVAGVSDDPLHADGVSLDERLVGHDLARPGGVDHGHEQLWLDGDGERGLDLGARHVLHQLPLLRREAYHRLVHQVRHRLDEERDVGPGKEKGRRD